MTNRLRNRTQREREKTRERREEAGGGRGSINSFKATALYLYSAWRLTEHILRSSSQQIVNTSQTGRVVTTLRQMASSGREKKEKTGLRRGCREVKVTNMLRYDFRREREKKRNERRGKSRVAASAACSGGAPVE